MKTILKLFPATVLVLLCCCSAGAQDFKNEFGFRSDNDSYLAQGSDRYYTNGLFIYFRHSANQQELKPGLEKKIYEFTAGQKMYNPKSGYVPNPLKQDRPFAGYLYGGFALSWFRSNESTWKASAEVGTTGPRSLAEDAQELLHNTIGFYKLGGWEYQIRDEFSVNVSAQYTKLMYRSAGNDADLSFEGYVNAGTTFSGAGAGVLFRGGRINQLFNSGYTNAVIGNHAKTRGLIKRELFFYAKPQLNFVGYDATVQGSMFNDRSPVTFGTRKIVFAQQVGVNYSSQRFTLDFGMLFKTREIRSTAVAHQFGSITMFYRFN
ncbi:lipid A deacylase LpxR family protein [Pedobacter sp. JY14-1]|uniref:lipid A deacylase LpxR family protein n=1 Tax=Pedobacter sp. JY14-1 TaxID=3034151 RepID=UPI0023E27CAF|nr:lipid A deacylase LpxR family protein [Pedobacter sp. JY14-1]